MVSAKDKQVYAERGEGDVLVPNDDTESGLSIHPDESPSWYMFLAIIPVLSGPFLFGYFLGFTSPAFNPNTDNIEADKLDSMMGMTADQDTWFGSVVSLGAGVGALICGKPVDRFGKKLGMIVANLMMVLGTVVMVTTPEVCSYPSGVKITAICTKDNSNAMAQLYTSRVILGLANGFVCVTSSSYLTELATLRLRGVLGAFFQNAVVAGIVSSYLVGIFTNWQGMAYFAIAIGCLGTVTSLFIPESPQWLVTRGRLQDAEDALRKMRSQDTDIQGLLATLRRQIIVTKASTDDVGSRSIMTELCEAPRGKALLIGLGLMATAQMNGIACVASYASTILGQVFTDTHTANSFAFYGQLMKLSVTIFASGLMVRFPRRNMLSGSLSGMIIACGFMCLYFFDQSLPKALVMIGYCLFLVSFAMGTGALSWLMLGEIFHPNVRSTAISICTAWNWALTFYISKTKSVFLSAFGGGPDATTEDKCTALGYLFLMYGSFCCVGLLFTVLFLPETLGKSYKRVESDLLGRRRTDGTY